MFPFYVKKRIGKAKNLCNLLHSFWLFGSQIRSSLSKESVLGWIVSGLVLTVLLPRAFKVDEKEELTDSSFWDCF